MTAHCTISHSADVRDRGRNRGMMGRACAGMAFASAMLLGGSLEALAGGGGGPIPSPAADHVYGGCTLSEGTLAGLAADARVQGVEGPAAEVSFVVVYTLSNDNDGQSLGEGGPFTGPIICINDTEVEITAKEADGDPLTEASDIPTDTDPGGADTVDVLETEESFIIKYQLNGEPGDIEKRICHTVDGNVDCFIIRPVEFVPDPGPEIPASVE